jgi:diguanylate cyclase (GGDEF)-like protein/PAS domain S-box-containing protein
MSGPDGSAGSAQAPLTVATAVLAVAAVAATALALVDERLLIVAGALGVAALGSGLLQVRAVRRDEARLLERLVLMRDAFITTVGESAVPILSFSPESQKLQANRAYFDLIGMPYTEEEFSPEDVPVTSLDEDPGVGALLNSAADRFMVERAYRHDDGRVFHVEVHANVLRKDSGEILRVIMHCLDVSAKHEHAEQLRRQLREDSLTGLLTRNAFEEDLLERLGTTVDPMVVIYVDVDRFKKVNDNYGHATGDAVLRILAERLRKLAPEDSLIARLGGDEFALAVTGTMTDGERIGAAIVRSCEAPFRTPGGLLQTTVSVGVSRADHPGQAEQAVLSADTAMLVAKQTGRDRLRTFDEQMSDARERRFQAEQMLKTAIYGDRSINLPVWYQPIVAVDTGQILGAEALVRLRTPDGTMVPPGVFIPVAEETGMVVQIGEHVLRTALAQLARWGDRLPYVSVNVSPRQLAEAQFVPMLAHTLEASGLQDRSRLVLEITETAVLGTSADLQERLESIKRLGVRLALDDFGTGYSSLTWLKAVPADIVKLDRSFVAGLAADEGKASIISAVLWLAKALNMSVVAEGVEDVADWAALGEAACPSAQGFLFSRPVQAQDFEELLSRVPANPAATPVVPVQRPA